MKQRQLGRQGLAGLGDRPRLHGDVRVLRRRATRPRRSPPSTARSSSASPSSTRPTCTASARNEELVGRAIKGRRDEVVLATKFGNVRGAGRQARWASTAGPTTCAPACEASLQRLGVETIDLYYQHRVDPETPIEDTVGAMAELVPARARCATSACPRRRRRRSAAPTPCTRSRRCRPSTRCGAATPRTRSCRRCASSASASSPTARSAAAS